MRRVGVIDQGTNSTRLLIADVDGDRLVEIERRTTVTRLGEGLEASGRLSDEAIARVADAVAGYRELLDRHGAETVVCVATSAMRDAANGDDLASLLRERYGVEPVVISGDEEARLTFLGATSGRPGDDPTLVIDIGGGQHRVRRRATRARSRPSTSRRGWARSATPSATSTRTPRPATSWPRSPWTRTRSSRTDIPEPIRAEVERGIAVAGTATSLAAIEQRLDPYDPDRVHGYRLTRGACEEMQRMLASLPVEERREVPGLHPDRAPTIVAGVAILARSLHAFGLDEVEVSEADILHGAALDAAAKALE